MNTGYPITFFMALGCRRLARAAAKLVAVVAGGAILLGAAPPKDVLVLHKVNCS